MCDGGQNKEIYTDEKNENDLGVSSACPKFKISKFQKIRRISTISMDEDDDEEDLLLLLENEEDEEEKVIDDDRKNFEEKTPRTHEETKNVVKSTFVRIFRSAFILTSLQ